MAWVGRHPKITYSRPCHGQGQLPLLAGCCFSVRILNKESQSSRKVAFMVAEFLHQKKLFVPIP